MDVKLSRLNQMNELNEMASPLSWIIICMATSLGVFIIFNTSFLEWGLIIGTDIIATMVLILFKVDTRFFLKPHPEFSTFYPKLNLDNFSKHSTITEKIDLFNALISFPKHRTIFFITSSYIKTLPCMYIFIWQLSYPYPVYIQILKAIAYVTIITSFSSGLVYLESHIHITRLLKQLHTVIDLTVPFQKAGSLKDNVNEFKMFEWLSLGTLWGSIIILQTIILVYNETKNPHTTVEVVLIGVIGVILVARLMTLSRQHIFGWLDSFFKQLHDFEPSKFDYPYPLASSALLIRFGTVFNLLMDKMKKYEQELEQSISKECEESRYNAIGEISGLVIHDLSNPLQTISFCRDMLEENSQLKNNKYLKQLQASTNRCLELIESLRSFLRNQDHVGVTKTVLGNVLDDTLRILHTQFYHASLHKIKIEIDPIMRSYAIPMLKGGLMHIFINILSNSIQNLLKNNIENPCISLKADQRTLTNLTILISDNGTGLSPDMFDILTGNHYGPISQTIERGSLGLRLIRRLIERHQGTLGIAPKQTNDLSGTTFILTLPFLHTDLPDSPSGTQNIIG